MNFKAKLIWINYLTPVRVWNFLQLKLSFHISYIRKKAIIWGQPFAISIEPTTACNLGCPECPSGLKQFTRNTGKLSLEGNIKALDSLGKRLQHVNYYFQGEPFIHGNFLDLVHEAKKRNLHVTTSTNAHFITATKAIEICNSGLDELIISLDGTTQETYEQYRIHGNIDKVIDASKQLVSAKKSVKKGPHLIFQFLVVKPNEHQINDALKLAKAIGIDEVRFKTAQLYDFENGNPLMPENSKYSRYVKKSDGTYKLKYQLENSCWRMWSSCVFTWDLKLVPCCFDKDAKFILGDLNSKDEFNKQWKSPKYMAFRNQLLTDRSSIDICTNCSEGAKVLI